MSACACPASSYSGRTALAPAICETSRTRRARAVRLAAAPPWAADAQVPGDRAHVRPIRRRPPTARWVCSLQQSRHLPDGVQRHNLFQARGMPRPMRLGPHLSPHSNHGRHCGIRWGSATQAHSNRLLEWRGNVILLSTPYRRLWSIRSSKAAARSTKPRFRTGRSTRMSVASELRFDPTCFAALFGGLPGQTAERCSWCSPPGTSVRHNC
jgi:hypothetical protein